MEDKVPKVSVLMPVYKINEHIDQFIIVKDL